MIAGGWMIFTFYKKHCLKNKSGAVSSRWAIPSDRSSDGIENKSPEFVLLPRSLNPVCTRRRRGGGGGGKTGSVIGRAGRWRALGFSRNRIETDEWERKRKGGTSRKVAAPVAVLVWNKGSSKDTRPRCNDFAHARNSILWNPLIAR